MSIIGGGRIARSVFFDEKSSALISFIPGLDDGTTIPAAECAEPFHAMIKSSGNFPDDSISSAFGEMRFLVNSRRVSTRMRCSCVSAKFIIASRS
jgi:NifU-like protein involved in Fe-S cluster formation